MKLFFCTTLILLQALPLFAAEDTPTGLQVLGLPYATYKDGEGIALSASLLMFYYGKGEISPYKWQMYLDGSITSRGKKMLTYFVDVNNLFGKTRLTMEVGYKKFREEQYWGLGNDTPHHDEWMEPASFSFIDEHYFVYRRESPFILLGLQHPGLLPNMRYICGAGYYSHTVEPYATPNKLQGDQPTGIDGGVTSFLRAGVVYDTRDLRATPHSGVWSELMLEPALSLWGSDYNFTRITMIDRRYVSIAPWLVYAQRFIFETLPGNPPFYDMKDIASSYARQNGLGGATSLRGIPRLLFIGQSKFVANFELRFELFKMTIFNQPLTFYSEPYLDTGRVWLENDPLTFKNMHTAYGFMFGLRVKKDALAVLTFGRSKYSDLAIYMTLGNAF